MRVAISELERFYDAPLGRLVLRCVQQKLTQAWGRADRLTVAGYGHVDAALEPLTGAERIVALIPEGMGAKAGGPVPATLVEDGAWPLPEASINRLVLFHALEEAGDPRRLLREAWRVLSDDGLMIIVVANRRGLWSMLETSPLAAGRPYSRHQLNLLLAENMFTPTAQATALHFPPFDHPLVRHLAPHWERMGAAIDAWRLPPLLPNVAGLNLVEARKLTALPIRGAKADVFRPGILIPSPLPQGAGAGAARQPARQSESTLRTD